MDTGKLSSRRRFLWLSGGIAAGLAAIPSALRAGEPEEARVDPVENLMRDHGVLDRLLLIYEETANQIRDNRELPLEIIEDSARLTRRFVHDYHEKLEEDDIFPRIQKGGNLNELLTVLNAQHAAGRRLTDSVLTLSRRATVIPAEHKAEQAEKQPPAAVQQIYGGTPFITHLLGKETEEMKMTQEGIPHRKQSLLVAMERFSRMYRPHTAREDTVVFSAFRSVASQRECRDLAEKFAGRQRELWGEHGFETIVESVAAIEKKLGIYDLSKFTPQV